MLMFHVRLACPVWLIHVAPPSFFKLFILSSCLSIHSLTTSLGTPVQLFSFWKHLINSFTLRPTSKLILAWPKTQHKDIWLLTPPTPPPGSWISFNQLQQMCNLNLNPTTCMAVRGVQYWSSSERITKLNELLNKIKKKKKALKWPNKTRQRQDVGLVTVDTKLTVYIQYDVPFKGQVLPILCTFSNSNFLHWYFLLAWESSMMDTGCLYNTSFTKREKKKSWKANVQISLK